MSALFNINFLNFLIIIGIVISAIFTVILDDILPCIIASSLVGTFIALEFLLLRAPDVAIAEGAVGAILTPFIFIITLRKVNDKEEKQK
ncbi:Na(+)/H(+) antiporter subunit B [Clostridium lundense]|uniref:Na(+)/H(+) antiporter subunit B n=1 Tax=Clostridium lundense TaxID=319475 RepID=UPI000484FC1C|nr:hydrogenase subunit MbhD domain-containing protein [Clostridium lundense]